MSHTPGPWKVDVQAHNAYVNDSRDNTLCRIGLPTAEPYTTEAIANARLMAAAPDLLDILEMIASTTSLERIYPDMLRDVRAAIAKAKP